MFQANDAYTVYIDIDSTIVSWKTLPMQINLEMVEEIKRHHARNHNIIFWSKGRSSWARKAVEELGLLQYATAVLSKPDRCLDDKQPEEFMPRSEYVGNKLD